MTTINVQFSDSSETVVVSYIAGPQDPDIYPNQAAIPNTDPRYLAFLNPPATPASIAAAALSGGLAVTSTGTPALNGTYAIDQLSQMDIIAIETSLNAGKGFPGGATAFNYADVSGAMHSFTQANFTDFAAAVRDYVYALKSVIAGASTTLPPATATIA
jgi:hypothetical protein